MSKLGYQVNWTKDYEDETNEKFNTVAIYPYK